MNKKGVFCLEGLWESNLRDKSSVLPLLQVLHTVEKIQYIHRNCATVGEFEFYINKWLTKSYSDLPILYLTFHGVKESILLHGTNKSLNDLSKDLEGRCKNRVIIFASCSVLNTDRRRLVNFLKKTRAAMICGYKNNVDWLRSTAFEMLLLSTLQKNSFDGRGIKSMEKKLEDLSRIFKDIDFRFEPGCLG